MINAHPTIFEQQLIFKEKKMTTWRPYRLKFFHCRKFNKNSWLITSYCVTYLSQISFGIITSSLSSHLLVTGSSWLIRFKLLARYLKIVSSSDGFSPSRNSCSLSRTLWLQIIFNCVLERCGDGFRDAQI